MTEKEAAFVLYLNGTDLDEISTVLKIPYSTLSKWSSKGMWKRNRTDQLLREQTNQERIMSLIDYQLQVIERITKIRVKELAGIDDVNKLKSSLIDKGDIDALQKLHTTIRSKAITWDQIVKIVREFMEHIESIDFETARKIQGYVGDWLNQKREQL